MSLTLPRESFVAIAAVGWADGWMKQSEVDGLLRAASACGLSGDDHAAVANAAKNGADLASVDMSALSPWERALTYAIASWLARLDGIVNTKEMEHLQQLGSVLDLHPRKLETAGAAAFDIACLPGGHRPDKFDFDALAARLAEKLPSLVSG